MIDFFETKAFGATIVGALTTIVSLFSSTNAGAAIGLGLFIASAFLLIFEKTALSRSPPDVTSARRANPPGDLFGVTSDQRPQCDPVQQFAVHSCCFPVSPRRLPVLRKNFPV
jgi:hypothetical protein